MNRSFSTTIDKLRDSFLSEPGKAFFLKVAADSVQEVTNLHDSNETSYVRKARIRTGSSISVGVVWCGVRFSYLSACRYAKHCSHFNGSVVDPEDAETGSGLD